MDTVGKGKVGLNENECSRVEPFVCLRIILLHSATEPGGAKGGCFYSKRYSVFSGLNSANLDFLPVQNIEDEVIIGGVGAVPVGKLNFRNSIELVGSISSR